MKRTFKDYFIIGLKGLAMGAADVVPGVSGGTIAFISGIYNELINSIDSFSLKTLKIFKQDGFKAMFNSVNGSFLLSLFIGIGISIVSLANLFKYLLEKHPILLWSFFFGLVLASILYIVKQIKKWNAVSIVALLIGTGIAYYITIIPPMNGNDSPLFLVLAGALAICAMILPGISGAFILLLLGAYKPAIDAIHNYDFKKIFLLALGAIVGLLSFAKI
jgi:putative membrane protein